MKYLITGGAGFIGSHLSERLLEAENEVVVIDDLSTGRFENIAHLEKSKHFKCYIDTVMNKTLMEKLVEECDSIYHLAAAVGVKLIIEDPVRTIETNILGTDVVLRLASRYRRKLLVTSTSEIYGKNEGAPFKEDDDRILGSTTKSRWSYSCSKAIDEFLCLAYYKEKKLPVIIVRLFNTVGPRQTGQYGMVIPRFVRQALANKPITVYGDGKQSRSFAHVKDITEALIELMNREEAIGEVFNIGSSEEITIEALAKKIIKLTGSSSEIVYVPYEEAYEAGFEDMRRRVADTSKINRLIGYEPSYSLEEILKDIISYFETA